MHNKSIKNIIFILLLVLSISVFWENTGNAITITPAPRPATVNKPTTFIINFGDTGCQVLINYGDGNTDFIASADNTWTTTHTYTLPGLYTVTVTAGICNGVSPPNPASIVLRVSNFKIDRIELQFKNNRPAITVKKHDPDLGLNAKINFSGTGLLKGYWEVDGFKRSRIFKHLTIGPSIILPYPKIPSLPTYTPGNHRVRFVITQPALNITFPKALYFVENRKFINVARIKLIYPQKNKTLPFEPVLFNWQSAKNAQLYLITLFANSNNGIKDEKEHIYSAYTRKTQYELVPRVLKSRLSPEIDYQWMVQGFDGRNEIIAQSKLQRFSFDKQTAFVPGNILFVTDLTSQGDKAILDIQNRFNLKILEQYEIVSLKKKVTLCFTEQGIFKIIDRAANINEILSAQPNYIFRTMSEPMSNLQDLTRILRINDSHINFNGKGVKIGIIDTGIDMNHKDLESAIILNKNFIVDDKSISEIHGTAVAGLIGARENNFGIKGIAPETKILALRACRQISRNHPTGECYSSTMIKALDTGIQNSAKIINMSLGAMVEDKLMSKLILAGADRGILFVAPAGNTKEINYLSFPASHPKVIAVAGSNENGSFFPNNTIGEKADFCAPCTNLFTTIPGNNHNFISGTSMSAAIISGLLALSCENNPEFGLKNLNTLKGDIQTLINHIKTK
jgi:hypothetical protein